MTSAFDPRLHAARPDLADARLRGRVEAARFVDGTPRRVVAPAAPLRRAPSPESRLDTEALMGERVAVFEDRDGYAWVQLERDGYVGYVQASLLGEDGPGPSHRVRALRTFVFPGPDLKLPPLAFLSLGAGIAVAGPQVKGFVPVATGGHVFAGRIFEGHVFAGHLAPAGDAEPDPVAVAERFLGTPYLWGGKTSLGLDCSGLVQIALAAAGLAAPRDSDMQEAGLGRAIDRREVLRRGDLVFWPGHVGIMLDGTRLLHANGFHMAVAIEPLAVAEERIAEAGSGPVTAVKRLAGPAP